MSVSNGQGVNAPVTNAAFVSRTQDSSMAGVLSINNTTESTTPSDGALVVAGGVGVTKSVSIGESLNVTEGATIGELLQADGGLQVTGNASVSGDTTVVGTLTATDLTISESVDVTGDANIGGTITANVVATPTANVDTLNVTNAPTLPGATFSAAVTFNADVTFNGTTTTVSTANLDVEDKNITVNDGGNDASSEGAGLTVERTGTAGSFIYANAATSKFKIGALGSEAEIATISHAQTLTNKTLTQPILDLPNVDIIVGEEQVGTPATPPSGYRLAYPKADGWYEMDSAGNEAPLGGGSGAGAINFIEGGDAESTSPFLEYADAADVRPVDGTGGVITGVSTSLDTSTPLSGDRSFLLSKDAVNRQGKGWGIDFTIDRANQARVLSISFDYLVHSGTFVAGSRDTNSDVRVFIYDVTNAVIIEPSNTKLFSSSSTIADKFEATFQTAYNSTSYRLIFHIASTSALSYELKVDNIAVSPSTYVYGTPITDWQSYTPTFTNFGTVTNIFMYSRRVGDTLEVNGYFQVGTPTGSIASMSLGYGGTNANVTVDSAKVGNIVMVGHGAHQNPASASQYGYMTVLTTNPSNSSNVNFGIQTTTVRATDPAIGAQWATNAYLEVKFAVPILGWSSSVKMSEDSSTREVSVGAQLAGTQVLSSGVPTKINFDVVNLSDKIGSYDASLNRFTAKSSDTYIFVGNLNFSASSNLYNSDARLYINGIFANQLQNAGKSGTGFVQHEQRFFFSYDMIAGQYAEIFGSHDAGVNQTLRGGGSAGGLTQLFVFKLGGNQTLAANDLVAASYKSSAGQVIPNATETVLLFPTKITDLAGSYNTSTGKILIKDPGEYVFEASVLWTTGTASFRYLGLRKTSVSGTILRFDEAYQSTVNSVTNKVYWQGPLVSGEEIVWTALQTSGGTLAVNPNADYVQFSMRRIG